MGREHGVYVLEYREGYRDEEIARAESQAELLRKVAAQAGLEVRER